jgi:chromosome segregation ATPase
MAKAIPNPGLLHTENPLRQQLTSPEGVPGDQSGQTNWSALVLGDSHTPSTNPGDGSNQEADVDSLFAENLHLRKAVSDLERRIEQASTESQQSWLDRQREYEVLLEEKSELIRSLHVKINELEESRPVAKPTPKEEELLAFSEELERERCQLEQEKRQAEELRQRLTEDEQEMLRQMRDMEVQMARERADFARQRTELQRILDDIRRELDNIERNGHLNQRLGQLRQRFQDVALARSATTTSSTQAPASQAVASNGKPQANGKVPSREEAGAAKGSKDKSAIRRWFRKSPS